ncbi:hypothetical protein O7605_28990 [Verrucosispora sp. WMMA2121]|uniref:hypothetical protein n=1 Tax=Verrucosispora sp. WMMA2121 TaxID=3015164 RepID=UPI0022B5FC6E|nr:hypothetical protein [Verrucosispora sp. WMMA2121]MCZ7423548.1 hypothetical protein [Verrucosispora sp. WMMA2121]
MRIPTKGVKVTVATGERRPLSPVARWLIIALAWVLTSATVLVGSRYAVSAWVGEPGTVPATALDARSFGDASAAPTDRTVAGSARLVPVRPRVLLDSREVGSLPAGVDVTVPMPETAADTRVVLVEVSILNAKGPGEVTVGQGTDRTVVLRAPKAGAQLSATVVTHLAPDGDLRASTSGGGDLLVRLVGVFEPAQRSDAGRIVAVPPTRVVTLVPRTDGKKARIPLAKIRPLADAGPISAVILQVSADVGSNGGYVAAGTRAGDLNQAVYWSATSGSDRTRSGLMVVPVRDGSVHLRYEAGTELRADLVGYVTGAGAPESTEGLVVPVAPQAPEPVRVGARSDVEVTLGTTDSLADVPVDRIAAALVTVTATGEATGGVEVGGKQILTASKGVARSALTLVEAPQATVRVGSAVAATIAVTPHALVLTG